VSDSVDHIGRSIWFFWHDHGFNMFSSFPADWERSTATYQTKSMCEEGGFGGGLRKNIAKEDKQLHGSCCIVIHGLKTSQN